MYATNGRHNHPESVVTLCFLPYNGILSLWRESQKFRWRLEPQQNCIGMKQPVGMRIKAQAEGTPAQQKVKVDEVMVMGNKKAWWLVFRARFPRDPRR